MITILAIIGVAAIVKYFMTPSIRRYTKEELEAFKNAEMISYGRNDEDNI